MSNGFILYRGPSMLDGSPIIAIATGTAKASRNSKTGGEVQTWIMRDDQSPVDAVKSGADSSICGSCVHRGDGAGKARSCYVTVFQAPLNVWKSAHRGIYPTLTPQEGAAILSGLVLRLGSYGDPAAVPLHIWRALVADTAGHTGYTHQWKSDYFQGLKEFAMASCDTAAEREEAKAKGWRTFRVMSAADIKGAAEVTCPASKEAGAKTSCALCKACGGTSSKARADISLLAHGAAGKVNAFNERAAA